MSSQQQVPKPKKTLTRLEVNVALCSVLTTLDETMSPAPRSMVFLALNSSLGFSIEDFDAVMAIGELGGLLTVAPDTLTITEAGRAMARRVREHVARMESDLAARAVTR